MATGVLLISIRKFPNDIPLTILAWIVHVKCPSKIFRIVGERKFVAGVLDFLFHFYKGLILVRRFFVVIKPEIDRSSKVNKKPVSTRTGIKRQGSVCDNEHVRRQSNPMFECRCWEVLAGFEKPDGVGQPRF